VYYARKDGRRLLHPDEYAALMKPKMDARKEHQLQKKNARLTKLKVNFA
jgi:hypothetical protein